MQWITIIGDKNLNLDAIRKIEHYGSTNCYDIPEIQSRYCVDYGQDHIFYDDQGESIGDYEETDLIRIPFEKPHFIMMIYSSTDRTKKVLQQDNFLTGIYIDNGHGLIVSKEEFLKLGVPLDSSL